MNLSLAHARAATALSASVAVRQARRYSSDAYSYSLPGGFTKGVSESRASTSISTGAEHSSRHRDPAMAKHITTGDHDSERTLVVTDAACDLPRDWLAQNNVLLLPIRVRFDSRNRTDTGDAMQAREFFQQDLTRLGKDAQALALSATGTQDFVEPHLGDGVDFVLEIALASTRGSSYMNSLVAAQNLMLTHSRTRRQNGVQRPFKMWVIDAATAFSGQGVLVTETVRALREGLNVPRVVQHVDGLRKYVHTLLVPGDVAHWHRHSRAETEAALGWLSYGMGKVLDRTPVVDICNNQMSVVGNLRNYDAAVTRALTTATAQVRAGLAAPVLCISYVGDTAEICERLEFTALEDACIRHGVSLHLATMSMTNAIGVGPGAIAVAFASERFSG